MHNETTIDIIALIGLGLVAVGVWLAYGWPLTLIVVGAALLCIAVMLGLSPKRGRA